MSNHEKSLNKIKELEFEVVSCQADVVEFQKLMMRLKEEQFKNKLCRNKVHRCSLKVSEMYEFLHKPINE